MKEYQNSLILPPLPESFDSVGVSHPKFLYRVLLEMRMNGIFDRPYLNDLREVCQPGDRVRVVFFTKLSDRNERVGEQIVLLDSTIRNWIQPKPKLVLGKTAKRTRRQLERKSRKKPPIQRFEGVVVASRWVRPLDILEWNPLRDFQIVTGMRRLLPHYWVYSQFPGLHAAMLSTTVCKQIFATVPHLPPRSQIVTVRKSLKGVSSEKTFCVNSPWVKSVERVYSSHVRRAKLYYLRGKTGKAARLKRRSNFIFRKI
jgi:ribosomal protein L19